MPKEKERAREDKRKQVRKEESTPEEVREEDTASDETGKEPRTSKARSRKAPRAKKPRREGKARRLISPDSIFHQIMPIVMVALAAFTGICLYTAVPTGAVGTFINHVSFGLLGPAAYTIPLFCLLAAVRWQHGAKNRVLVRSSVFALVCIFLISVMCYTFGMPKAKMDAFSSFYSLGIEHVGGGVLGGIAGFGLNFLFSKTGTVIITVMLLLIFSIFVFGLRPKVLAVRFYRFLSRKRKEYAEKRRLMEEERAEREAVRQSVKASTERAFYETNENTLPESGRSGVPAAYEGKRAVVRCFYDADADADPDGGTEMPVQERMQVDASARPAAPTAAERRFFDDEALFSEDLPPKKDSFTILRNNKPIEPRSGADTVVLSEDEDTAVLTDDNGRMPRVQIVSESPIPENAARPFEKRDASADPFVFSEEDAAEEKEPLPDPFVEVTEQGSAEAAEDGEGAPTPLVINKAHVIEHIGADKLMSDEEQKKKSSDTFFYSFPPLSLLHEDDSYNQEDSDQEISIKAKKLRDTLESYGVRAEITCVSRGPRLTRYELVPDNGVRIRAIENLVDEITMNLEAVSVRIEAPIPGKAAIGVEVPNVNTTAVRLRGLLDTDTFRDAPGKTTVCLGVDVVGVPVFADLDKMPHLLVAGATGMGKSVCINSILISLLYKARPDEVKLILIDPKKVEFQSYCNIPHLLVPVVTEPQKAAGALSWAVNEMERRYDLIESAGVRNIAAYNKTVSEHPGRSHLPQIVVVIDELHDLMIQARDAVEDSIARIAAKARAAGILLIIGTQRPSVNVITGVIKANIPSRIAFHVASQVDSRTILDTVGAEKLLNNGDMLFLSPGMKMMTPKRVQGAFLDDDEVNRVAEYLRKNSSKVEYDESIMADMDRESEKYNKDKKQGGDFAPDGGGSDGGSEDDLLYRAIEVALENGKVSTSLLQRRLSLGFGKAARMIDRMQDMGIVGPPNGQKPRDVLVTLDEYRSMRLRNDE